MAVLPPSTPLPLRLYRGAGHLFSPFARMFLDARLARGKEDGARLNERLGQPTRSRPGGPLVWCHAASVGESISLLPLIEAIAKAQPVLLTTGTVTSAALAAPRLPANAFHQFVPVDTPRATAGFLDHWQPDLAIFCESELWPGLITGLHQRGIPAGIVNGRMSSRSFSRWEKLPHSARALLGPLRFCLAQSAEDATRYSALGARAQSPGNLKFDGPKLAIHADDAAAFAGAIADRPVFLWASTHPGEEDLAIAASKALRKDIPDLLTLIVPRHPHRGADVARLAAASGDIATRRSAGLLPGREDALYIADTLGELGLFYANADIALIGGSLVPQGGHNPIEAIKLGCPVLSGPHTANFKSLFAELAENGGVRIVHTVDAIITAARILLSAPDARASLSASAEAMVLRHEGALTRTLDVLAPYLGKGA